MTAGATVGHAQSHFYLHTCQQQERAAHVQRDDWHKCCKLPDCGQTNGGTPASDIQGVKWKKSMRVARSGGVLQPGKGKR